MRKAIVKYNTTEAGILIETDKGEYQFTYTESYLINFPDQFLIPTMPVTKSTYRSKVLFPFFDGLIPEGWLLNIAADNWRINKNDRMGLLLACCQNTIGAVSIHEIKETTNG